MSISASPPPYTSHSFTLRRRSSSRNNQRHSISKFSISGPLAARPSRQSSTSSISSSYSSRSTTSSPNNTTTTPTPNLSHLATHILTTLYNTHTPSALTPLIHPSAHFTSEHHISSTPHTHPSRAAYISHWESKLALYPFFHATIGECIVDESQGKVWVMSDVVTDEAGLRRRQVVDMLTFNAEGRLVEGNGFFRRMSKREDDE